VAIAAPQIGYSLRIFVISQKFTSNGEYMVCINPKLTKLSKDKKEMDEGCLSVRSFYGKVPRSNKATIEAFDETGKKFIRGASGLISQVFQHEMDHLNGILFIDKAKEIEQIINDPISRQNKSKKWKR
jgi:peptide deformylase